MNTSDFDLEACVVVTAVWELDVGDMRRHQRRRSLKGQKGVISESYI